MLQPLLLHLRRTRYLNCISKLAEFTTELAVESYQELNLPYTDPFTLKKKRISDSIKLETHRSINREQFINFCNAIRKREGFLRKATEQELQGIFERLTPAEKQKYSSASPAPSPASKQVPAKEEHSHAFKRKSISRAMDNFINDEAVEDYSDYSSDDVSLVSESENELEEVNRDAKKPKKEKKAKKEKKEKKHKKEIPVLVKKFAWK